VSDSPERIEPPFRCPGYPLVPLLFIASAFAMTVLSVLGNPWETLPWFGVLAMGVPMYYVWRALSGSSDVDEQ
jgi:APA family basic amino acid/polyamine antiporter